MVANVYGSLIVIAEGVVGDFGNYVSCAATSDTLVEVVSNRAVTNEW